MVGGQRGPLDVAGLGRHDDDVLLLDEVLGLQVAHDLVAQLGPPLVGVGLPDLLQLAGDDLGHELVRGEDLFQLDDQGLDLLVFLDDLLPLEVGQALELDFQDGLGLELGQLELLHQPGPGRVDGRSGAG